MDPDELIALLLNIRRPYGCINIKRFAEKRVFSMWCLKGKDDPESR